MSHFVNKIISSSKSASSCELYELVCHQEHKHSFICKKKFQIQCRFKFPQPSMKKTQILNSLSDSEKINAFNKQSYLQKMKEHNDMKEGQHISWEELLKKLDVDENEYIVAIRSC